MIPPVRFVCSVRLVEVAITDSVRTFETSNVAKVEVAVAEEETVEHMTAPPRVVRALLPLQFCM